MKQLRKNRKIIFLLLITVAFAAGFFIFKIIKNQHSFSACADFEPIETVYLIWNDEDSTITGNIAAKISPFENVTLFVSDDD